MYSLVYKQCMHVCIHTHARTALGELKNTLFTRTVYNSVHSKFLSLPVIYATTHMHTPAITVLCTMSHMPMQHVVHTDAHVTCLHINTQHMHTHKTWTHACVGALTHTHTHTHSTHACAHLTSQAFSSKHTLHDHRNNTGTHNTNTEPLSCEQTGAYVESQSLQQKGLFIYSKSTKGQLTLNLITVGMVIDATARLASTSWAHHETPSILSTPVLHTQPTSKRVKNGLTGFETSQRLRIGA